MRARPQAYVGKNHETIGADILAIHRVVTLPKIVLGAELASRISNVQADGWYPIEMLLEMLDKLESSLGEFGLRSMGWSIFQTSHAQAVASAGLTARDIIYSVDELYRRANRGEGIGGWRVLDFGPGRAKLEKTTPHPCAMEEGILEEAMRTVGAPARVFQTACIRKGAPACQIEIDSKITGTRWSR